LNKTIEEIVPNCFWLVPQGQSCNSFLLKGEKKNVLVDSGLQAEAKQLRFSVMETGLKTKDIGLILHSHCHADHFSSDFLFESARVRMHKADAKPVEKKDALATASNLLSASFFPKIFSFFRKGETINLGNFKLKVLFTPGHTVGSVCFLEQKNKILFSGDALFNNGVGRTDLPGGSAKQLLASLELLEKTDFEILCPGHGSILKRNQKENIIFAKQALRGN